MDFSQLSTEKKKEFAEVMFHPLSSAVELKNWIRAFLDLEIPLEITDPDSNSSPLDAIWQIYHTFKTNSGDVNPGYIILSCREGIKCQIKSTTCMTSEGYKKIEEIKKGDTVWTGFSWQKVTQTFDEGLKPGLKVHLKGGHKATGTPIHRYWCLRNGTEQWIAGKDLNTEIDLICLNVNTGLKNSKVTDQEKYEIGYFLGLLIGDGCLTQMNEYNRVGLTTQDKYIRDFFYFFNEKYLGNKNVYNYEIEYRITSKDVIGKLKGWGLTNSYSWEKTVPSFAYSHIDAMKGFIAGVFDTDGCWDKKGDCFFEMTAGLLLDQMQVALTSFGIESTIRHNKKLYGLQKHLTTRLSIGQTEAVKFEKLDIIFKAKKARSYKVNQIPNCKDTLPIAHCKDLLDVCSKYGYVQIRNRKHQKERTDQIKHYRGVTVDKLRRLCLWMNENNEHGLISSEDMGIVRRYEKILLNKWKTFTIEDVGEQYFYDLTVENEHSYWSNGLISHNTVSAAILELLLMLHFQLEIAHAAATEDQSAVGISYINQFIGAIGPLMEVSGWIPTKSNKRTIKYRTPQQKEPYIKILICSVKGMNSLHANVIFLDELDLADPKALKQGKNITGYSKGIYGVTVYLSTRKYAFGNMNAAIESADEKKYKIVKWNILDVTEACPPSRHLPDEPKEDRYVAQQLPLRQLSKAEFDSIPDAEKHKYELIKDAYAGCKSCLLLPVCKKRLSEKPQTATGGFYKPIVAVMQKFRDNDPDTAASEIMCWRPGSEGLIYPRFNSQVGKGNVITYKDAYETLMGPVGDRHVSELMLLQAMFDAQIPFYAGVDWGYTHDFVIVIMAILPNGEVWLMDTYASPGLEFADQLEIGKSYRDKYKVQQWFCDTAMPSHLKSFTKNGMKAPKFTKDVLGGIEATRSKITDASGRRLFKVISRPENKKTITALTKHRFLLDGQGNPTMTPDDDRGIADICDTIRYIGQNKWPVRGPQKPNTAWTDEEKFGQVQNPGVTEQMKNEIVTRVSDGGTLKGGTGRKGGVFWDF